MDVATAGVCSYAAPGFETPVRVKKTRMSREASNLGVTAHQLSSMAPTLTPQTPETPQKEIRIAMSIRNKALIFARILTMLSVRATAFLPALPLRVAGLFFMTA